MGRAADGTLSQMASGDAANAIEANGLGASGSEDVLIFSVAGLSQWTFNGTVYNKTFLDNYCQSLATALLPATRNPQKTILMGAGFSAVELGGRVCEVRDDQEHCRTTVITDDYDSAWRLAHLQNRNLRLMGLGGAQGGGGS